MNGTPENTEIDAKIHSLQAELAAREETIAALNDLASSTVHLIEELERRWEIKLEHHTLSTNETKLHSDFVKSLGRIKHRLSTSADRQAP